MDCDTTGVEPDFALVKFKKLAGGGYFKIANESVAPALKALGYNAEQSRAILTYLLGTLDLDVPMPVSTGSQATDGLSFKDWLLKKGFTDADLEKIESSLPGMFELKFAFGAWSVGDDTLKRLGIDAAKAKADPSFNLLKKLGLKDKEIDALNTVICGTQTVEGAPHLNAEHLPVFDCANKCGKIGKRFIAPEGHIRMMAAAQPFISGAISKTINLPNEAKVEDITRCYRMSWELGLKANALYRDGCKLSQPLSSTSEGVESEKDEEADSLGESSTRREAGTSPAAPAGAAIEVKPAQPAPAAPIIKEVIVHKPMRRRLPDTRRSITHRFNVAGHEGYLTVGLYEDGAPGELFITMAKEGSTIGGLMDSLGTATSVSLQYGVPVESLVNKFTHQRFEPAGMTMNAEIPFAKSLVDYIFRWMGMQFIPGYREANAPQRPAKAAANGNGNGHAAHDSHSPGAGSARATSEDPAWTREQHGRTSDALSRGVTPAPAPLASVAAAALAAGGQVLVHEERDVMVLASPLSKVAQESMADAPACDVCGTITVRSGTCYKCLNCGNSMGCS
jgi:ribonucleoside-diphosphate reductase alpha chain